MFAGGLYAQADAPHGHYAKLAERNLPVVFVNAAVDWLEFPRVSCDDAMAAEQAIEHLVALGHRHDRPAPRPVRPRAEQPQAGRRASRPRPATASTSPTDLVARAMFSAEGGQAAATSCSPRCHGDHLRQRPAGPRRDPGRAPARPRRPGDVSVVGYDDSAFMNYTDPPLTTVRQPIEAMGRAAVDRLVSQLEGRRDGPGELLYAPELVVRSSTGALRLARRPLASRKQSLHLCVSSRLLAACRSVCLPCAPAARRSLPKGEHVMAATGARWWRDAVIYQLYVRSFADGNGDGVGDLAGVRARLGYLRDLGVDAIWFNPWYASPLADGGYDVADYRAIEPAFGTLAEAEALIAEALDLGIRTIIDIVPNHVSDQHPWFIEALDGGPGSPMRDRFWFRRGRGPDGDEPPNGWTSHFGDSAWTRTKNPDGTARRLVPAPVRAGASPT